MSQPQREPAALYSPRCYPSWLDVALVVRDGAPAGRAEIIDITSGAALLYMELMPEGGAPVTLHFWSGTSAVRLRGQVGAQATLDAAFVRVKFDRYQDDPLAEEALAGLNGRFGRFISD